MSDTGKAKFPESKTHGEKMASQASKASPTSPTPISTAHSGIPTRKLKPPTNFSGSTASLTGVATLSSETASKIARPCCLAAPKSGPPPRDTKMNREGDDNLSSINSAYTDMYQETVKRFTRSSLSPEMDRYSSSSPISTKSSSKSSPSPHLDPDRRMSFDFYVEATGRRRSSDQGAVLTVDTEQFIIGQRVWVGGVRAGQIAYIGETHFAPGEWAGIVLDEPNGKNDGCVAGKRYFQCEPKRGIFSRLTRLTLAPLPGAIPTASPIGKCAIDRSHTASPTASIRSATLRSPGKNGLTVGDRVIVSSGLGSRPGILRYLGETRFAAGNWCGIELDEATGKNDGSVDGFRYFECQPKYGVFVPIAKVSLSPSSKKSRLSRAGSRESLNSIATANSSTTTSRLRATAQRKTSSIKPISTPKSQFSMQDHLREKQNHIEQLMIERDLDREEAQNQALQFQKNITELQNRIEELESQLNDERKKTDDLQVSMDEATFCGDELNAQTQVYREKINELEKEIQEISSTNARRFYELACDDRTISIATANQIIARLSATFATESRPSQSHVVYIEEEEQLLHERILDMQAENKALKSQLLETGQSLQQVAVLQAANETLRHELEVLQQEMEVGGEKKRPGEDARSLEQQQQQLERLTAELNTLKSTMTTLDSERSNVEDECDILRAECKLQNKQLQESQQQVAKLAAELSAKTECAAQDDGSLKLRQRLDEKLNEIVKLKAEVEELQTAKQAVEEELQEASAELQERTERQDYFEKNLKTAALASEGNLEALWKFQDAVEQLKQQLNDSESTNERLNAEREYFHELEINREALQKELQDQVAAVAVANAELADSKKAIEEMQTKYEKALQDKDAEIEQLTKQTATLEMDSSTAAQQLNTTVEQLETERNQLQQQLESSEAQLEAQRQAIAEHEGTIDQKMLELSQVSSRMESTSHLLDKSQSELTSVGKRCSDVEEQLQRSEERNAQLELQLGNWQRNYDALKEKGASMAGQIEGLQKDISDARGAGRDMQLNLRQLTEELVAKQKDVEGVISKSNADRFKLESQLEELQLNLVNKNKDCKQLCTESQTLQDQIAKCKETIATLEKKTVQQELALSDALRLQENLETRYAMLATQNAALQQDLIAVRSSSTDSNAELMKLSQEVAAKQKAYEALFDQSSTERSALEGKLQASQQRVDTLGSQVEALTQEVAAAAEQNQTRLAELKLAEEKYSKQAIQSADLARKSEALEAKISSLEQENESLNATLAQLQTESSSTVLKLSEELSRAQKALNDCMDDWKNGDLQRESEVQELKKRFELQLETLKQELESTVREKQQQAEHYENRIRQLKACTEEEVESAAAHAANEQKKEVCDSVEEQLKSAEEGKLPLTKPMSALQHQIQMLQDELLKCQSDSKAKEEGLLRRTEDVTAENTELGARIAELQASHENNLKALQETITELQRVKEQLQQKEEALDAAQSKAEELKLAHEASNGEIGQLEDQLLSLENELQELNAQWEQRSQEDAINRQEIDELKAMVKTLQDSNRLISSTNNELSLALKKLEDEKCETAHNFELFELEADQNAAHWTERCGKFGDELHAMKRLLQAKNSALSASHDRIEELTAELHAAQKSLAAQQSQFAADASKFVELQQANEELSELLNEKEGQVLVSERNRHADQLMINDQGEQISALCVQLAKMQNDSPAEQEIRKREQLEVQVAEYKRLIDESDGTAGGKLKKIAEMECWLKDLEQAKLAAEQDKRKYAEECVNLMAQLDSLKMEKMRDVVALQGRIYELQSSSNKAKKSGDAGEAATEEDVDTSAAQIDFLNSIIADMQQKNDTLKAKIDALEAMPLDFTQPNAFDIISKRKPAPRLFCDICDVFDQHETEDCPMQASSDRDDSPPPRRTQNDPTAAKERELPEPRKYCESCEVFGHNTTECDDDDCY